MGKIDFAREEDEGNGFVPWDLCVGTLGLREGRCGSWGGLEPHLPPRPVGSNRFVPQAPLGPVGHWV